MTFKAEIIPAPRPVTPPDMVYLKSTEGHGTWKLTRPQAEEIYRVLGKAFGKLSGPGDTYQTMPGFASPNWFRDGDKVTDNEGWTWTFSKLTDTWKSPLREARSYPRLLADCGPLTWPSVTPAREDQ